jgi:endonuclease III
MASKRAQKAILQKLKQLYPDAKPELCFTNPYETLIAVMLSAQSTDVQVNKATPALFARYATVADLAAARVEDVFPLVRSCGFQSKATHIVEACRLLMLRHGGEVPQTMEALTALPGVGRKTANVVLANAFGVPTIAVDTHVFRVSNRTGLAAAKTVEETERQLQKVIPREDWISAHHWLIFHGRRVCHARNPACGACTLAPDCDFIRPDRADSLPAGQAQRTGNTKKAATSREQTETGKNAAEAAYGEPTGNLAGKP